MNALRDFISSEGAWFFPLAGLIGATLLGYVFARILITIVVALARGNKESLFEAIAKQWRRPASLILPLVMLYIALGFQEMSDEIRATIRHVINLALIASVAWLGINTIRAIEEFLHEKFDMEIKDNLKARKVHTQAKFLGRALITLICIVAFSAMVMTFENIRQLGQSILASAGLVGLIVGFAAQRSIATFLAGLQIAFTQPIRIDDVVIVEGEWGHIEEISLTYVVVRIWDLRRLVLPITYFIENPFQNWTRVSADILGTVYLYVDYKIPVDELRAELKRVVEQSDLWDGKVCGLVVTNAKENVLELRALVSATDSGRAWDLRCHVREKLVEFIQRKYPEHLPRLRAEMSGPSSIGAPESVRSPVGA